MATINTLPARRTTTIQAGSPWPGVRVRYVDPDGEPEDIEVFGQVRTGTVAQGGRLLADCTVTEEDGGWWLVWLPGEDTGTFPERQVLIDVDVLRKNDTAPTVVMKIVATVEGEVAVQ